MIDPTALETSYIKGQNGRLVWAGTVATAVNQLTAAYVADTFNVRDYGADSTGATSATAAITAAVVAAAGRPVYLPPGNYLAALSFTDEHVNLYGPGKLIQPQGSSAIFIRRSFGAAVPITTCATIQWGASGTQGAQLMSALTVTGGGYSAFLNGDAYHISSNDNYTWFGDDAGTLHCVQAGFLTVLGVGLTISGIANGGPLEGIMLEGVTSGSKGIVVAKITEGGTNGRVLFSKLTGDFTPGENLKVAATGGSTAVAAGTILGVAGAMYLLKSGIPFADNYATTVIIRKMNRDLICKLDVDVDIIGAHMDDYLGTSARRDAILIEGQYRPEVKARIRSAYGRGLVYKSCYRGHADVTVEGLPNHTPDDWQAFGYGFSVSGASEGVTCNIDVRNVRHGFTTNNNYTALWYATGISGTGVSKVHEWGTVKRITVTGYGQDCTGAVFDTHPGAYEVTFDHCRGVESAGGARTASTNTHVFSNRGYNTKYISCTAKGSGFTDSGLSTNPGFHFTNWYQDCIVEDFMQYGFSMPYAAVTDGAGGYYGQLRIKGCNFSGDGTASATPYVQNGINLNAGRITIESTRVERCNGAPMYITAASAGVMDIDLDIDYLLSPATVPIKIDGQITSLSLGLGVTAPASGLASVIENVSGSTSIRLSRLDRDGANSLPPILANTAGTATVLPLNGISAITRVSVISTEGSVVTLTPRTSSQVQEYTPVITTDRVIQAAANTSAIQGDWFHITRTAASTGAFNLIVKNGAGAATLKNLIPGSWCVIHFNGTAWTLRSYGTL